MGNSTIQLSTWEKLDLLPAIIQSVGSTLASVILYPFSSPDRATASTFKRHAVISLMISVFGRLSTRQLQYLTGDSPTTVKNWAKSQNLPTPQSITLPDGTTQAFYLGDKSASRLILYFHGGGFALPATAGHLEFLSSLSKMATQNNKSAAVLLLDYDTAPASQYPRQLTQAVEFLRYITTILDHAPSSIILAGDSAGGSLILGLLGHILHPHPSISPLTLKEPLRGAAMSSPVVDLDFSKPSFSRARLIDPAPVSTLNRWMADYVGAGDYADVEDFYLQPGRALASWWEGSERAVEEILIAAAEKEGMVGDISNCARKIQAEHLKTTLFLAKDDIHAEPSIGLDVGFEEGDQAKVIKEWIVERL